MIFRDNISARVIGTIVGDDYFPVAVPLLCAQGSWLRRKRRRGIKTRNDNGKFHRDKPYKPGSLLPGNILLALGICCFSGDCAARSELQDLALDDCPSRSETFPDLRQLATR